MKKPPKRTLAGVLALLAALALLSVGSVHARKVYEPGMDDFGMQVFQRLDETQLVIDATFGGVTRQDGRLFSTYDRAASKGKRACPT